MLSPEDIIIIIINYTLTWPWKNGTGEKASSLSCCYLKLLFLFSIQCVFDYQDLNYCKFIIPGLQKFQFLYYRGIPRFTGLLLVFIEIMLYFEEFLIIEEIELKCQWQRLHICCSNVTYFSKKKVWVQEEEMEFLNLENKSFNNFYFFLQSCQSTLRQRKV